MRQQMSTCALCFSDIVKHNDKNLVNGKGAFITKEELSTLGFVVHLNSSYFSKRYVQKLKKRRGVINIYDKPKQIFTIVIIRKTQTQV